MTYLTKSVTSRDALTVFWCSQGRRESILGGTVLGRALRREALEKEGELDFKGTSLPRTARQIETTSTRI
jgi:hypothetical protein